MKHASFKLRFLSPAFLGGAYPKREGANGPAAELRVPSILGQLRWWHRFLGDTDSEARIFGSVAGESGSAAGFSVRLSEVPAPVTSATSPHSLGLAHSYFLYAQEMDNGANLRAALPQDETFTLVLINRRLSESDWQRLISTTTTFGWLGALGNRSRRGFGALTIEGIGGRKPTLPEPSRLLPPPCACAIPANFKAQSNFAAFVTHAGDWLRDARREIKDSNLRKSEYFGSIADKKDSRRASPIILRPWLKDGRFHLLLIGQRRLLEQVFAPSSGSPEEEAEPVPHIDPVQSLLHAPFTFDSIARYRKQVLEWQSAGRDDLVTRFVELTQDPKYGGMRSHPWYPTP